MSALDLTSERSITLEQRCVHSVCEMGLCARANMGKLEHKPMSAIELIGVRSIIECKNFKQKQK